MNRDQEIKELATKLHRDGVARSFMDAVRMAESMITTDMTPSKKPISNLDYTPKPSSIERKPRSYESIVVPTQESNKQDHNSTPAREMVTEIISEIESESQASDAVSEQSTTPEARSAESIEKEIELIEHETEPIYEQLEELETEEELQDRDFIEKEEEVISKEVTQEDILAKIQTIETEIEPQDEIVAEHEAEELLDEPELFEPETTKTEIAHEIHEVENEPNTITEVVDEPVSSHADVDDDDDEFIVSSEDITKLF